MGRQTANTKSQMKGKAAITRQSLALNPINSHSVNQNDRSLHSS